MSLKIRLILQLLLVAAVTILCSWLTIRFLGGLHEPGVVRQHYSIHEELKLSKVQLKALAPLEQRYEARWKELESRIDKANRNLAASLRRNEAYSPAVASAIDEIARSQGELQEATIRHVLEMKPYLTPQQYRRLLDLCADSIEKE